MTIESQIAEAQERIAQLEGYIQFLEENREKLEGVTVTCFLRGYDFEHPNREQTVALLQAFPGKWTKEVMGESVNYTHENGKLRIWCGAPPPSCVIVEREEVVPAQPERVIKRRVLQCMNGGVE